MNPLADNSRGEEDARKWCKDNNVECEHVNVIDMDMKDVKTDHEHNKKELEEHKEEMRKTLQEVLDMLPAGNRMAMLQDLSKTEPFNQYMDVIHEMEEML